MQTLDLKAEKRTVLGKAVRSLRARGLIPAELYGKDHENVHLTLNASEFDKVYKEGGENTIINIQLEGETRPVLVQSVQTNPISNIVLSVDLHQVNLKEKVTANVPLEFVGEAPAVEELGGVLNRALDEIEVEALPMNIPHSIEIDISILDDFSKSITVADLASGVDFEILTDQEAVVANVSEPREEEEEPAEEMSIEDIEVEAKGKAEEGDEGSEEGQGAQENVPEEG